MIIDLSNPAHLFISAAMLTALIVTAIGSTDSSGNIRTAVAFLPVIVLIASMIVCIYSLFQLIIKSL